MADADQLSRLLYDERGEHWKKLAEEYANLSAEFAAKARDAQRNYETYRDGRPVAFPLK